jgi:GNAT superfamily N-acetyltransferase
MPHPFHDELRTTVQRWYMQSDPAMGYEAVAYPWGVALRNRDAPQYGQATLRARAPEDVPACIAALRQLYGSASVMVLVDDRDRADQLHPALIAAGCVQGPQEAFLAHLGAVRAVPPIAHVTIEPVTTNNLHEYAVTKLNAFASRETAPPPDHVEAELALRAAELRGEGRFLLARWDGEPAAIIGWYDGEDVFVFQLATRVPFRKRGIARLLLLHVLHDAYARSCRSVIINADPDDTPIQLYRRLGFTDEVYWRRRYMLFPPHQRSS